MARNITVSFSDGSKHVYQNAPDDITPAMVQSRAEQEFGKTVSALDGGGRPAVAGNSPSNPGILDSIKQGAKDLVGGAVRGAGSIGATILAPVDAAANALGVNNEYIGIDRRKAMDEGLKSMGVDTDSTMFKGGKLASEIAGTAGVGGALARGVASALPNAIANAPRAQQLLQAIGSSGMRTGAPVATALGARAVDIGTRVAGGALSGGASAGLVDPHDAPLGAAIGGAFPAAASTLGAAGRWAGRKITGGPISDEVGALAKRAGELDINIPADRIANSRPLNALAASLEYLPFSGRSAVSDNMQKQLNTALSRTFGQNSDNVTMALRKADTDLGNEFGRVLRSNSVHIDSQFVDDLAEAASRAKSELAPDQAGIITRQIDHILEKEANGVVEGQAAYNIKKTLDRIGMRHSPEGFYALDVKNKLMQALDRSLGPEQATSFANTRKQYGNMIDLQKLAQNGAEGDVSIGRLANMKNINNNDLQELADISAQFLKTREGNHGALQRAVAGLGAGAFFGPAALASGVVGGRAANAALNSQWMKSIMSNTPQQNRLLNLASDPRVQELMYRSVPVLGNQ